MLRNRMLADPSFLFKVGTEVSLSLCVYAVFMCITGYAVCMSVVVIEH